MQKPTPLPFVYGAKVNRSLVYTIIFSLLTNATLVIGILYMLPLKEKEIYFVEFRSDRQNFVQVEKAGKRITSNNVLTSQSLRRYVKLRNQVTGNIKLDKKNFDIVCAMSTPSIREKYSAQSKELYLKKDFQRDLHIDSDSIIGDKTHSVTFTVYDTMPSGKKRKMTRTAYLQYDFESQENVPFEKRLENPTGLKINEYYISNAN